MKRRVFPSHGLVVLHAAALFAAPSAATADFLRQTYVAVQAKDLEGPMVDTGTDEASLSDSGGSTQASGHAQVRSEPDIFGNPRPSELGVYSQASVGDPGPADDTGAFAVASARMVKHVHARAASPGFIVDATVVIVEARVHGSISLSGEDAEGTLNAVATAFDPNGFALPARLDLQIPDQTTSLNVDHTFRLIVHPPLFSPMIDYNEEGMGLELSLDVAAEATGRNSTATLDFSGTMGITAFNFYDAQGNFVPGVTVVDESGATYAVNVPEPAGLALLPSCLAAIGAAAGRRAVRSSNRRQTIYIGQRTLVQARRR